jgi:glycosyltransferase involved in cell wall biosynthesis
MSATAEQMNVGPLALDRAAQREWPRIALVTPVFNSVKYVEPTIRSVLLQDYPNLDYFIVDGGSTDGTIDIIRKYENQISNGAGFHFRAGRAAKRRSRRESHLC